MAKRNKSAAIRAVIDSNPSASVKEIQAALLAQRMKVSPSLIHQVRGKAKPSNGQATFDQLLAAKSFVAKMGSVEAAKVALDSFAKLTG
jgi:hypothetical protein